MTLEYIRIMISFNGIFCKIYFQLRDKYFNKLILTFIGINPLC
jgi:hypothetical protein